MHHSGHWENKAAYMHYMELVLELAALSVDFMHHLHMIVSDSRRNYVLETVDVIWCRHIMVYSEVATQVCFVLHYNVL